LKSWPHHPRRHTALWPKSDAFVIIPNDKLSTHIPHRVNRANARAESPPRPLFPKLRRKAERKILESVQKTHEDRVDPNTPKLRVFFPWKAMVLISVLLTEAEAHLYSLRISQTSSLKRL